MTHVPESLTSRRTMSERALADAFADRGAAPGVQDVFLNTARRERLAVIVHLMTGHSFDARIKGFDRYAVMMDVDGARVLFGDGWGLVRASNTQPVLVLRFEAKTQEQLTEYRTLVENVVEDVKRQLHA